MSTLKSGEELLVETTDPLASIDIPHFCREDGHELLGSEMTESGHRFRIRKGKSASA